MRQPLLVTYLRIVIEKYMNKHWNNNYNVPYNYYFLSGSLDIYYLQSYLLKFSFKSQSIPEQRTGENESSDNISSQSSSLHAYSRARRIFLHLKNASLTYVWFQPQTGYDWLTTKHYCFYANLDNSTTCIVTLPPPNSQLWKRVTLAGESIN